MKGYFPVDYRSEEQGLDCRFLFKPTGKPSDTELADALKESLRRITYPDVVYIVAPPKECEDIEDLCNQNLKVAAELQRASDKVCIVLVEIAANGKFTLQAFIKNRKNGIEDLISSEKLIYQAGLVRLFHDCNVLVKAPPGFIFLKPSGDRARYFLRAESAIFSTERVHFLACCLIQRMCRERPSNDTIETIYIDTMAISSVAYVFRDLYCELMNLTTKPNVISFHSYEGIEQISTPFPGTSLCLISASSSMNMQRQWQEVTSCSKSDVITLITLAGAENHESALFALPYSHSQLSQGQNKGLRDLRILGENFSPEEIAPKAVLLKARFHKLKGWAKMAPAYSKLGILSVCRKRQAYEEHRRMYIDGCKLVKMKCFLEFVDKMIKQRLPISVNTIVYQADESSKELANHCASLIQEQTNIKVEVVCANETERIDFSNEKGLLLVAAVIGKGTQLLSLTRSLRKPHKGPRHYLIGFHLGEEWSDLGTLKSNLEFSREGYNYRVETFEFLAVGTSISSSFEEEIDILQSEEIQPLLSTQIQARLDTLNQSDTTPIEAFLPPASEDEKSLILRPEFAFWDDNPEAEIDHSACLLATAAGILQNARELQSDVPDSARMSSDAFQQVTLDPENFARFNDGIIQAALLRAARSSELDYSSNEKSSGRMKALVLGIFNNLSKEQGEAALEFGLAIATRKLKLTAGDTDEILNEAESTLSVEKSKSKLLLQVLREVKRDRNDRKPF